MTEFDDFYTTYVVLQPVLAQGEYYSRTNRYFP